MIAVGPNIGTGTGNGYFFSLGSAADASLLGGGNVMFVPELSDARTVYTANIWNYQGQVSTLESYGILGSSLLLQDRAEIFGGDLPATLYGNGGQAFTFVTGADFFNFLCFRPYNLQGHPKVDFAVTPFDLMVAYVSQQSDLYADTVGGAEIFRDRSASLTIRGNLQQAAAVGAIATAGDVLPNEGTVIQVNP